MKKIKANYVFLDVEMKLKYAICSHQGRLNYSIFNSAKSNYITFCSSGIVVVSNIELSCLF